MSPTKVAAPSRLEPIAMAMTLGTGEIFSFFAMVTATGATIRTVATLSTKAEMTAAKTDRAMIVHLILGTERMIRSASREGMRDSMKILTMPIVPAIIIRTFQSTAEKTLSNGRMPKTTKITAATKAT